MRCVASANKNTATSLVQDFQFSGFLENPKAVNSTGDKAPLFLPAQRGKGGGPGSTWHLHIGLSPAGPQHVLKMRLVLSQDDLGLRCCVLRMKC